MTIAAMRMSVRRELTVGGPFSEPDPHHPVGVTTVLLSACSPLHPGFPPKTAAGPADQAGPGSEVRRSVPGQPSGDPSLRSRVASPASSAGAAASAPSVSDDSVSDDSVPDDSVSDDSVSDDTASGDPVSSDPASGDAVSDSVEGPSSPVLAAPGTSRPASA